MNRSEVGALLRELADSPNNRCFVCGPQNPVGLRMRFEQVASVVRSETVVGRWHQGWEGVTHGGIIAAVLDEAMAYALFFDGIQGLTGRMEVRYRDLTHEGDRLEVEASIVRYVRSIADVVGSIRRDGRLVAEATGRFIQAGPLTTDVFTEHASRYRD
jgi:acyl-coenzyme A thioesterase PaaI-like protein